MSVSRINGTTFTPRANFNQNVKSFNLAQYPNKGVNTISFTANPRVEALKELLLLAEDAKKEAAAIIQEAKPIYENIKAGKTEGLKLSNGFVYVYDDAQKLKASRRFYFDKGADSFSFYKHSPETGEVESSFIINEENLKKYIQYKNKMEDSLNFDDNGQVKKINKYNTKTRFGEYFEPQEENYGVYSGRFGDINLFSFYK